MPACPTRGRDNPADARFCNACGARLDAAADASRAMSGERRVVTMLFCDVRGSTSMAEQLDPEDWTDSMNEALTATSSRLADERLRETFLARNDVVAPAGTR
jgi:class 3 adenylate cyclase